MRAGVLQEEVQDGVEGAQMLNQVHGDGIVEVAALLEDLPDGDAMITRARGLPLVIKTADCQPLVLVDEEAGVAAAVHAGWRSLVLDIIPKTLERMLEWGCSVERIKVGIGPSLGVESSLFSSPYEEIPEKYHWAIREDGHVDLNAISSRHLEQAGVRQVERMNIDTFASEEWYSWRRDKDGRRFGTLVGLV